MHDLVPRVEDLRTTMQTALDLERHVRGATAGFNTPAFVVDAPGGGGKRDVHSFEHYDRTTGISVYTSPSVRPGQFFLYYDPIHLLPDEGQLRWANPTEHQKMIDEALDGARAGMRARH
jgi:lysine 2,3-aminomutase